MLATLATLKTAVDELLTTKEAEVKAQVEFLEGVYTGLSGVEDPSTTLTSTFMAGLLALIATG